MMNKITGLNTPPKTVRVKTLPMGTLVRWKLPGAPESPESVYIVGNSGGGAIDLSGDGWISSDAEVTVIPAGAVLTITVGREEEK
jgi:hypothetical protein